jgi:hypothetical protein
MLCLRYSLGSPRPESCSGVSYFVGLSVEEAAEVLKVSLETVNRDWRMAKVWLLREVQRDKD